MKRACTILTLLFCFSANNLLGSQEQLLPASGSDPLELRTIPSVSQPPQSRQAQPLRSSSRTPRAAGPVVNTPRHGNGCGNPTFQKGLLCGVFPTLFLGTCGIIIVGILDKAHSPTLLTPCAIPATIDPATDMSTCWSECAQQGDLPLLCGTQAYSPMNITAGSLMQKLQTQRGQNTQVCLSSYDCGKINNAPYSQPLLDSSTAAQKDAQRSQIKRNNARAFIPKNQTRKN